MFSCHKTLKKLFVCIFGSALNVSNAESQYTSVNVLATITSEAVQGCFFFVFQKATQ